MAGIQFGVRAPLNQCVCRHRPAYQASVVAHLCHDNRRAHVNVLDVFVTSLADASANNEQVRRKQKLHGLENSG